jgi:hypothetical protein
MCNYRYFSLTDDALASYNGEGIIDLIHTSNKASMDTLYFKVYNYPGGYECTDNLILTIGL